MTGIDTLLRDTLGLATGSVGPRVIEAAVAARMAATGCATADGYLLRLRIDPAERGHLTEAVVVPETWFFRYPESFAQLVALAQARRATLTAAAPFRVLCVPCSTGEEPYSVALTLDRAGFTGLFRVEAVDVSLKAVAATRAALYPASAFRETGPVPGREVFTPVPGTADRYAVPDLVKQAVRVRAGNVAVPGFLAGEKPFDAIFCRNLFIYLTADARRTAAARFHQLLAPGGRLFLGHAEPVGAIDPRFQSVGPPQAFMVCVAAPADRPAAEAAVEPPKPLAVKAPAVTPPPPAAPTPAAPVAPADALVAVRAALDSGRAADAVAPLTAHLSEAPTADGYTLLGVAHLMLGRPADAERALTQALYLDPGHYDALVQLLALAQTRGDSAAAANYRRRAAKAQASHAEGRR